ncbi:MAG: phosphatase PAP2 family protein [Acidimicrobiales bacterium]
MGVAISRRRHRRQPFDAMLVVAGTAVMALSALPVSPATVSGAEEGAFRAMNDLPDAPFALVWAPMQLGSIMAVPAAALVAAATRRVRMSLALALGGLWAWLAAKVVKSWVMRGRPGALVEEAVLRDAPTGGLGFVSGHAAVAVALATLAWPYLGSKGRAIVAVLAILVGALRIYVGAHLPLDIVGGAGLGLVAGGLVHLALGRPSPPAPEPRPC